MANAMNVTEIMNYIYVYKQNECYLKSIKCGSKRGILHKSIFTRTKLKPNKVLHLLYC